MNLSVVIVSYRSNSLVQKLLESLVTQSLRADEVIVIDNGPEKSPLDLSQFPEKNKIKYFPQEKNLGYGKGCNKGFLKSKGKFYLIIPI